MVDLGRVRRDGAGGLSLVGRNLGGGATQEVSVVWNVPDGNVSHQIYVVVDPDDTLPDRDRSNNSESVLTVLPDLVVDSTDNTQEGATNVTLYRGVKADVAGQIDTALADRIALESGIEVLFEPGQTLCAIDVDSAGAGGRQAQLRPDVSDARLHRRHDLGRIRRPAGREP